MLHFVAHFLRICKKTWQMWCHSSSSLLIHNTHSWVQLTPIHQGLLNTFRVKYQDVRHCERKETQQMVLKYLHVFMPLCQWWLWPEALMFCGCSAIPFLWTWYVKEALRGFLQIWTQILTDYIVVVKGHGHCELFAFHSWNINLGSRINWLAKVSVAKQWPKIISGHFSTIHIVIMTFILYKCQIG